MRQERPAKRSRFVVTMTQSTKKLLTTVAFAALASTALPSFAQEAPATVDQAAPAAAPVVEQAQPAPPVALPQASAAPVESASPSVPVPAGTVLKVPTLDVPAPVAKAPVAARAVAKADRPTAAPIATKPTTEKTISPTTAKAATTSSIVSPSDTLTPATPQPLPDTGTNNSEVVTTASAPVDGSDWGTIGGLAAVGGLTALGIGGLALSRRRRPLADDDIAPAAFAEDRRLAVATPGFVPIAAPSFAARRSAEPVAAVRTVEPAATSGLGRHMAAAAQGPTAENPFLTERARMRRARFLDKREAMNRETAPEAVLQAKTPPANRAAPAAAMQTTYVLAKAKPSLFGFRARKANA